MCDLMQSAGLIPLSHASAGPLLDIILPYEGEPTGFHALTAPDFAARLTEILSMTAEGRRAMRVRARESVRERFGREAFEEGWKDGWRTLVRALNDRGDGKGGKGGKAD